MCHPSRARYFVQGSSSREKVEVLPEAELEVLDPVTDVLRLDPIIVGLGSKNGRGWANHVLVNLLLRTILVRSGPEKIAKYSFLRCFFKMIRT